MEVSSILNFPFSYSFQSAELKVFFNNGKAQATTKNKTNVNDKYKKSSDFNWICVEVSVY